MALLLLALAPGSVRGRLVKTILTSVPHFDYGEVDDEQPSDKEAVFVGGTASLMTADGQTTTLVPGDLAPARPPGRWCAVKLGLTVNHLVN